ncbi:hypothetical protein VQH23_12835 [Pararoseomonas sp. SCSIO 73927]|uniref:hypothetical protein n=1 Tax=Pararoseomonas sp. SCSIO 73927 TaxID=3114537 RepID=UPI0030D61C40
MTFPEGSLLASILGGEAPVEVRRAAQRLRAEGAPALAVSDDVASLAGQLAASEVSRSPAVLDALPPLFWIEARPVHGSADGPVVPGIHGWLVEKKRDGLAARRFGTAAGDEGAPGPAGATTVSFGAGAQDADEEARTVRGLVTAVCLPEMLSQMGELSPVAVLPADAPEGDAGRLRNFRLSVAVSAEAARD